MYNMALFRKNKSMPATKKTTWTQRCLLSSLLFRNTIPHIRPAVGTKGALGGVLWYPPATRAPYGNDVPVCTPYLFPFSRPP